MGDTGFQGEKKCDQSSKNHRVKFVVTLTMLSDKPLLVAKRA